MQERVTTTAVASALGNWSIGPGSVHRRLADAFRHAIDAGILADGALLPPERTLAPALAVSRSTLTAALAQLKDDQLLASRQGSGTRVVGPPPLTRAEEAATVLPGILGDFAGIDLAGAVPGDARGLPPLTVDLDDLLAASPATGYAPAGIPSLRDTIAAHWTEVAMPTERSQVLVTTGAHDAIALAFRALARRGETVLVDDPTYPGFVDLAAALGLTCLPVPRRDGVIDLAVLRDLILEHRPRLAFLQPTVHAPTGSITDDTTLRWLAEICDRAELTVVEDLVLHDVAHDGSAPAPLAARCTRATVLSVGSVSKLAWGGVRVGWLRGPEALVDRLVRARLPFDLGTSVPAQVVAREILANHADLRITRRAHLRERRDRAEELLREHCPAWRWISPAGGLSLWIDVGDANADAVMTRARRTGVVVAGGRSASVADGYGTHLRLCFDRPEPILVEGIRRLGVAAGG